MKRLLLAVVAVAAVIAVPVAAPAGAQTSGGVAGYGLSALAAGVSYQLNSPGFLPVGDPAEGTIMEFDVPLARTNISQGPLINAVASPAYPGDTVAHLGTALQTFGVPIPIPNYPILAESNYPPTPDKGASTTFSSNGVGEGRSDTSANGAKVYATSLAQSIPDLLEIASTETRNDLNIAADKIVSTATSRVGSITIAGVVTIDGVTGIAQATSDGSSAKPSAALNIGKVTVAGQAAYIDDSGVHVVGQGGGDGVVPGVQQMVNGLFETDGLTVRTISPKISTNAGAATASAGALAITIDRKFPAVGLPGVPALELPGAPPIPLGTPDLPTHTQILIGEARIGVNATAIETSVATPSLPDVGGGGGANVAGTELTAPTGPGASAAGALGAPLTSPSQSGGASLNLKPTAQEARGKAIPIGLVLFGIFVAFAISGPLLGYARWQLLEGRHR